MVSAALEILPVLAGLVVLVGSFLGSVLMYISGGNGRRRASPEILDYDSFRPANWPNRGAGVTDAAPAPLPAEPGGRGMTLMIMLAAGFLGAATLGYVGIPDIGLDVDPENRARPVDASAPVAPAPVAPPATGRTVARAGPAFEPNAIRLSSTPLSWPAEN